MQIPKDEIINTVFLTNYLSTKKSIYKAMRIKSSTHIFPCMNFCRVAKKLFEHEKARQVLMQ